MKKIYQNFHITVKALVINQGKLLLVRSSDKDRADNYECPGGRIDKGEEILYTLKRELKEEINLNLDNIKYKLNLYAVNQRDAQDYNLDNQTNILEIYYEIHFLDPLYSWKIILPKEHRDYLWIDKNVDLNELSFRNAKQKEMFLSVQNELNNY